MRYLASAAMRKTPKTPKTSKTSKTRKPPLLNLETPSQHDTSPHCSSVFLDCDADDEGMMSGSEFVPSRPLSVAIPQGSYRPRRPTLAEVLANAAPPPWTLSAFTGYLSQNHCLETLEFTMDANRYRSRFNQIATPGSTISPNTEGCEYVKMLWQRLLSAYIVPNGPREVNLPSDVRDRLLSLSCSYTPPAPESLDPAVKIIYDLMDESVLVPFLNSVSAYPSSTCSSTDEQTSMRGSLDDRLMPSSSYCRDSPPPQSAVDIVDNSFSPVGSTGYIPSRHSQSSHLTAALSRSNRLSTHVSNSSSQSGDTLTDDSSSASFGEPMTPPTTPPMSDIGGLSPGMSPRSVGNWKKMTGKFAWKKKSGSRDSRYPSTEDEGAL
jgi:hypothetical protein